ncbi:MAG TPA: RidA family protein [Alphaproteobacteria bacterium]|nr:RidA family protein [Alphaproteobacteria bacterium]
MVKVWYENPEGAAPPQGRYSHVGCVEDGKTYFLAGQLSVGADGAVVGVGDFDAQFRQVFGNLHAVLAGVGLDWDAVIKFTTYLVHSQDIPNFMRLRTQQFPEWFGGEPFPPNTLLVVDRLVKEEFLLEVEAVVGAP